MLAKMEDKRNLRKERIGVVTSNKMDKSIVVAQVTKVKHPLCSKQLPKLLTNCPVWSHCVQREELRG